MATLIGLCIRVKLLRVLPSRFKVRRAAPAARRARRLTLQAAPAACSTRAALACAPGVEPERAWRPAAALSCSLTPPQADIRLTPGSHASEAAVNKQLADKERVAAALENPSAPARGLRRLGGLLHSRGPPPCSPAGWLTGSRLLGPPSSCPCRLASDGRPLPGRRRRLAVVQPGCRSAPVHASLTLLARLTVCSAARVLPTRLAPPAGNNHVHHHRRMPRLL